MTYCALCGSAILDYMYSSDMVADHIVLDIEGDLDYIELAHRSCAVADNNMSDRSYWEYHV